MEGCLVLGGLVLCGVLWVDVLVVLGCWLIVL